MSRQGVMTGITNRHHSGRPPEHVATHPIDEMIVEAAYRHARQLAAVIEQVGCLECGEPAAVIQYPPDWEVQMIGNLRNPGVGLVGINAAVEIRERVRFLCAAHAHYGWEHS